jgi:hypothetical protein
MTVFSTFYDILVTKLHNFTKFRMLFTAVLMNLTDSKFCLFEELPLIHYNNKKLFWVFILEINKNYEENDGR